MPFDAIQAGRGGDSNLIKEFQEIGNEKNIREDAQMQVKSDERLDEELTGLPKKTEAGKQADRNKHLAAVKRKEDQPEAKKVTRPISQIARDFAKKYPRHNETTLVAVRRLVKQAKSTDDIKKFLAGVYKDNPLMHLEVLAFIEDSSDETTDMPDHVKELVKQAKQEIQEQLVAEGGEANFPTEPSHDVVKPDAFKNLYEEVANQPEVNAHEMFNKISLATKGDLSNLRQVAGSLLKRLADDIRNTPENLKNTERELMQTRISEMRAVIAFTQVPPVFDKSLKLVDKQYGAL